jgi:hypothetical protein
MTIVGMVWLGGRTWANENLGLLNRTGFSGGRVLPVAVAAGRVFTLVLLFVFDGGEVADRGVIRPGFSSVF